MKTIAIGDETDWSSDFRSMLEQIPQPYMIVLIEDYLLTQHIDTTVIEGLITYMEDREAGCLRLYPCPGPDRPCPDNPLVGEISKGADYRLSLQAAVWDKQTLLELLRDGESAWELELNGTKRTNDLDAPFLGVIGDSPIPYFCTGVVKGKWVKEAVKLCETEGIEVDLTARSIQTPIDRLLRSARVGRSIEFARERSTIANKFINFVKSRQ